MKREKRPKKEKEKQNKKNQLQFLYFCILVLLRKKNERKNQLEEKKLSRLLIRIGLNKKVQKQKKNNKWANFHFFSLCQQHHYRCRSIRPNNDN